jgi:hypothetical protein
MKKLSFDKIDDSIFQSLDVTKMKRVKGGITLATSTIYADPSKNQTDGSGSYDCGCND